ncbi:Ribophorin I [Gongronella butleri]|nr:Ribophorin I [Gongronella butleri]
MAKATRQWWLWAVLVLVLASVAAASPSSVAKGRVPIPEDFKNLKVLRVLDTRTSVVHEDIGIRAENIGAKPVNDYYFIAPRDVNDRIAHLEAFLRQEPRIGLNVENVGFDSEREIQVYKVKLPEPLAPGQEVRLGFKIAHVHALHPYPEQIPQMTRQYVQLTGNVFMLSPYTINELKTTVQLPPGQILSYTDVEGLVQVRANKIVYGAFKSLPPFSEEPIKLHFEFNAALLTVRSLHRDLWVSHWGDSLTVEEHYDLRNDGAELKEHFNRVRHMMSRQMHSATNMVTELSLRFPAGAKDAYFRDEIGNVSTSHFRQDADASVLEIRPRYPVFGGWIYNWYHGYTVQLGNFLRYAAGQYILNVNFVDNARSMTIDKARVTIVLPEGATNVQVFAPFALDREEHGKHFSNFDTTGRYLLTLEKDNVVFEHEKPIQIVYTYPQYRMLQKPFAVFTGAMLVFLLSMAVSKIKFSIGSPKKSDLKKA